MEVKSHEPDTTNTETAFHTSLHFQFGSGLENGVEDLVPQLLLLNRAEGHSQIGLEICMLHRRHATMFDVNCKEGN